jgi:hypothetical protein
MHVAHVESCSLGTENPKAVNNHMYSGNRTKNQSHVRNAAQENGSPSLYASRKQRFSAT